MYLFLQQQFSHDYQLQLEKVTAQSLDTPALQILIDGKTQTGDFYEDITYGQW